MNLTCCKRSDVDHGTSHREQSRMFYTMYVVSVRSFLAMRGTPPPHQILKEFGLLSKWRPSMFSFFVSHQWVGGDVPDPSGEQLQHLRSALENIISGFISVENPYEALFIKGERDVMPKERVARLAQGYMWLDWFSVPQISVRDSSLETGPETSLAVDSIPAYVAASDMIIVLVPEVRSNSEVFGHTTWLQRGWCRLEMMAGILASLSRHDFDIVVVRSAVDVSKFYSHMSRFYCPGSGRFTVEDDRVALFPVLSDMIDRCIDTLSNHKDHLLVCTFRALAALRGIFLAGLGTVQDRNQAKTASSETEAHFLKRFLFESLFDAGVEGFGPLACAALCGNVEIILKLAALNVDLNSTVRCTITSLSIVKGHAALHLATMFSSGIEVIRALVVSRCNVSARNDRGVDAFHVAAFTGNRPAMKLLLDYSSDINALASNGYGALQMAAYSGHDESVRFLLERGASIDIASTIGFTTLHISSISHLGNPANCVKALLAARADVNCTCAPSLPVRLFCAATKRISEVTGCRAKSAISFGNFDGATAVALASLWGDASIVKLLLEASADPTIRNDGGLDALDLARLNGHRVVEEMLLDVLDSESI